ncbi:hypothetical protein GE09DRAFT_1106929 [Coniochaeta sp. 2T2.1]|nr:hypothetical protein GE09DRAFT_1106929 [Coniochaeta sp. 2T2.1]
MAPPEAWHTVDHSPEYEEFIAKLTEFHTKRGTSFDPTPKLGVRQIDLLKLYKYIVAHGGYDAVSDEKLAWRKSCEELGLMTNNPPAAAFQLKTHYYRYLAAYEIKTVHNKEPPPPEILEHTTAKGSGLLTRTLENYAPNRRETGFRDSDNDEGTPLRDRPAEDTPGSSARASRGLRQDPPQRVIYTPETSSSRQPRHPSGQHPTASSHNSPRHSQTHSQGPQQHAVHANQYPSARGGASHSYIPPNPEFQNSAIMNYDWQRPVPLPVRPVRTPATDPNAFAEERRVARLRAAGKSAADLIQRRDPLRSDKMFEGPNIYLRCIQSLLSRVPAEQAFALHHLVKISFERGDKFRFEQFPKLVEGLVDKGLEVGQLFYDVDWAITYDSEQDDGPIGELDGNNGTSDIIERIEQLAPKSVVDGIMPADFSDRLGMITEAVLTIRNMVMLLDNAAYIADYPVLSDLLCIILHLPKLEMVVELKHFALDIAEQITPYLVLQSDDPLYRTLLGQLLDNSDDRGTILTALRAVGRSSMNLSETNQLGDVPLEVLQKVKNWLLLNDDELMDACLDFLYQYTAVVPNLESLIKASSLDDLVTHLVRLLSHGAKREQRKITVEPERRVKGPDDPLPVPADLLQRLLAMPEPERCHTWVRCFFEEDPEGQVTQISIWQGYNSAFLEHLKKEGKQMIQAAEFIRSISQVYTNAAARIKRELTPQGETNKFIIDGIRPRIRPINEQGLEYYPCLWARKHRGPGDPPMAKCLAWLPSASQMWKHIITEHLGETLDPVTNAVKDKTDKFICYWHNCGKYNKPTEMSLFFFSSHIKLHAMQAFVRSQVETTPTPGGSLTSKRSSRAQVTPARTITIKSEETLAVPADPRNPNGPHTAGGIPLSAALVLRNIARNIVKTEAQEELLKEEPDDGGWNERLFRAQRTRLHEIMAENKLLAPHVASLLQTINDSAA